MKDEMRWIYKLPLRLRSLFRKKHVEQELSEELQFHLEKLVEENVAKGMSGEEARYAALREFGGVEQMKEECRDSWGVRMISELAQDVRYGLRQLRRNPGFTVVAVLTLALGIGANTATYSLIDAIIFRTLPVSHPESLVMLTSFSRNGRVGDFGYRDYQTIGNANRTFAGVLAASNQRRLEVGIGAETETALCKIVSANYFSVLGVQTLVGRTFNSKDANEQVAIISYRFWERSFTGSPSAIGKQIDIDGLPFTIVGVAPPDFLGETVGEAPEIWATVSLMPAAHRNAPGVTWLNLMGRLKPQVKAQQASSDLALLLPQLRDSESQGGFISRIAVEKGDRGSSGIRDSFSAPLGILMAVVAVVLLIACVNLASLQLARAAKRQREIVTRLALGASRGQVVRQLVTESALLALLGGALGLLFATWCERVLLSLVAGVGRAITVDLHPDLHVLAFTATISVATGVLFGLVPAIKVARQGVGTGPTLNSPFLFGRGRRRRFKDGLIAIQVALSLLLLIVSGLFIRTIRNLRSQDLGFRPADVLSVQLIPQRGYRPIWANVILPLLQRTEAIPEVHVASVSFNEILANDRSGVSGLKFEGYPATREEQRAQANWVGPGYFATSGITILDGREFSSEDNSNTQKVAIFNRTMARKYFRNQSAVGRWFEFNSEQYEIIGVARDAKYEDLRQSNVPLVYFAALQNNTAIHSLEIRTHGSPLAVVGAVRAAIREVSPRLRIGEIATLGNRINQKLAPEFLVADISSFFSALALLLVFIGIYGTLAYTVARRTREIGVRMALGAEKSDVLRMVIGQGLKLALIGVAIGIGGALALTRFLSSLVYGVKPADPLTFIAVSVILLLVALLACYIPAQRAAKVDPMVALRYE
jgi:predicted permease